ncbi:hypothetical protein [Microvirga terricola]|uniref:DUF945 domain-containing protein n=1 Tax=Microvirga terricola TaxID=2719797 RepID=A0ABX0VC10_9HYPH|nr:hypothetical protein [Microvirga terricola]NIX77233.1 hypothetical protein [Microvirga terricola]
MTRSIYRSGICALALIAGSAALQFEPAIIHDIGFARSGTALQIGAVRTSLWSAAWAQAADTFSLENVRFTIGTTSYEAKRVDLTGVTSPRATIEALFASASTEPVSARLSAIGARQITIPELKVTQKFGPETQTNILKNVVLKDVANGRIATATADTIGVETSGSKTTLALSYGRMSISDFDLPAYAKLFETRADSASSPPTKIHGAFTVENIEASEEGVNVRIARVAGRDFMARTTKDSWTDSLAALAELGGKGDLSEEDQAKLVRTAADLLSAFDFASVEATGIEITGSKAKDTDVTGRINRMAYTGATASRPADARIEGMEFFGKSESIKIGTISLTGFSFGPTFEALKKFDAKTIKDADAATVRSLIPTWGTMHISGVDIDVSADKGKKDERAKLGWKDLELTADKPVNGIPTNIRIGLQNLAMELPAKSDEEGIRDLIALGYKNLDLSLLLSALWNAETEELNIREYSLSGQDMGSISMTGLLGGVTKDVFDPDTAIAAVALVGAKAKALDITVENKGLFERYLEKAAKEQKTKPETLRATYGTAAAVALPSIIGTSEQAKALSQAIARFIAKPGRLTVNAKTKDPSGLSLVDITALQEPADAFVKLNVTAKAE